jgi:hypothetical protein
MKKLCFTDSQIMSILKQAEAVTPVAELIGEKAETAGTCRQKLRYEKFAGNNKKPLRGLSGVR